MNKCVYFEKDKKSKIYELKNKYPKTNFRVFNTTRQIEVFLNKWRR